MRFPGGGFSLPRRLSFPAVVAVGVSYDAASIAYFAAMSVQPDATRKGLLNALIAGLKADGVWALLDWVSFMAAHDAQAARINAKTPAQVATVNGTLTFTADRGYRGDGSTGYLETGVSDNAAGNWTQNAASMMAWLNVAPSVANTSVIGLSTSATTKLAASPAVAPTGKIHGAGTGVGTTSNSLGLSTSVRTDSVTIRLDRNGVNEGGNATTVAAGATAADTFQVFKGGAVFGDPRVAAFGWGGILDATKSLALYNRLNTYLTAVGGN